MGFSVQTFNTVDWQTSACFRWWMPSKSARKEQSSVFCGATNGSPKRAQSLHKSPKWPENRGSDIEDVDSPKGSSCALQTQMDCLKQLESNLLGQMSAVDQFIAFVGTLPPSRFLYSSLSNLKRLEELRCRHLCHVFWLNQGLRTSEILEINALV